MRIALHARPAVLASCVLLGLNLLALADRTAPPRAHGDPGVMVVIEYARDSHGDVIAPPSDFADARPYPEGMVIAPPATGDAMNAWGSGAWRQIGRTVDHVLSGLIAALLAPLS